MKTKSTLLGLLILLALTIASPLASNAQYRHYHHPHWVDVHHCRVETRNVYFPAYNFYYDMESEMFIYLSGDRWVFSLNLPVAFAHVDLAYEPMVELDFYDADPYLYNHDHIVYYRDYHNHFGRRDYREYGHNHEFYRHGHHNNDNHNYGDRGNRHGYDHRDYDRHGNGNSNHNNGGNHYEKKGNNKNYSNHNNNSHRDTNGNGRSGNGRNSNERGGRGNGNGNGNHNNGKGHRM